MSEAPNFDRWNVWLTQARRFARRENYFDALGRAELVLSEVKQVIEALDAGDTPPSDQTRRALARYQVRVERTKQSFRAQFDAWNAKIAARRHASILAAEQEMNAPLPLGPDEFY